MKTFDLKQFAEAIRQARGKRSLRDISKDINISFPTLSRYENMKVEPKLSHTIIICEWMGKKIQHFVK